MARFAAGDDLIFQLESGYGLLRVLAVETNAAGAEEVWHLMVYEELFPNVEAAEEALATPDKLHTRAAHLALTERAFERTPAARLGHRLLTEHELAAYRLWVRQGSNDVSDRSVLLLLGLR